MAIANAKLKDYRFLQGMYQDSYFPNHLVDKGRQILIQLCETIESTPPESEADLYMLTHAATNQFNELAEEFLENDSEIETAARDCIATDFSFVATAYGFPEVDQEELVATRDW